MAYQLVTAPSNQEALMSALNSFAVSEGWTSENYTASNPGVSLGVQTLSRGNVYVSFRWEGTEIESEKSIAMYQALGYSGGSAASPWLFTDDSGAGTTGTSLQSERRVEKIGSGPYISFHMFASDTDGVSGNSCPHIHCVLEYAPGKYRHFSFGNIDKFGDWTGGEYVCGHRWRSSASQESDPVNFGHSFLLDGICTDQTNGIADDECATLHVEGLPDMTGAQKWGQVWDDTSPGTDTSGETRVNIIGGARRNIYTYSWGQFIPSSLTGFVPLFPMPVFYRRDTVSSNCRVYLLGYFPNARMVQLRNFNAGDEVTIGSNTWKIFPVVAKSNLGGDVFESDNMGVAYLKTA